MTLKEKSLRFFYFFIVFCSIVLICLMAITESGPPVLHEYSSNFNLFTKQIFIPEELADLRASNDLAKYKLQRITEDLHSIKVQRDTLQKEVETLSRLLESEAYNVKPSKTQLLEQALMEEKLLKEKVENGPGFVQLCLSGFVAFVLLKSIILLNIGWDSSPRTR